VFQKSYTENILGIGRNKSRTSYFYRSFVKTKDETEGGQRLATPQGGAAQPLVAPTHGERNTPLFVTLFKLSMVIQKLGPTKTFCAKLDLLESIACLPCCCKKNCLQECSLKSKLWANSIFVFL
jgi:hypothetical protein